MDKNTAEKKGDRKKWERKKEALKKIVAWEKKKQGKEGKQGKMKVGSMGLWWKDCKGELHCKKSLTEKEKKQGEKGGKGQKDEQIRRKNQ